MSVFRRSQPYLCLSPMDGVTDSPMRQICKKYGRVDLLTSEFVNVEGLHFARERLASELQFSPGEQPLLLQIYGLNPEFFAQAATLGLQHGFSGIDLNFGCPAKSVVHAGAGAGLIANPHLAQKIYQAVREAVDAWAATHPGTKPSLSIKTRLGVDKPVIDEWFSLLLSWHPDLITVHGRTLKQGYTGQADWQAIGQVVALRSRLSPQTAIFGNGDVTSLKQALARQQQTGVDGVVIGRAALGNPWVFTSHQPTLSQRLKVALEHALLYEKTFAYKANYQFYPMRKHLAAYARGFPGASLLRQELVNCDNSQQVAAVVNRYLLS